MLSALLAFLALPLGCSTDAGDESGEIVSSPEPIALSGCRYEGGSWVGTEDSWSGHLFNTGRDTDNIDADVGAIYMDGGTVSASYHIQAPYPEDDPNLWTDAGVTVLSLELSDTEDVYYYVLHPVTDDFYTYGVDACQAWITPAE